MDIKELIKENDVLAAVELDAILAGEQSHEQIHAHLVKYARYKFLLHDDIFESDDIAQLAKRSIVRTLERTGDEATLGDLSKTCAGVSSATTKHLLLIIAIKRGLEIDIDPDTVAHSETFDKLASAVEEALDSKMQR